MKTCADLEGRKILHCKIIANMPQTPPGKHNYPTDPPPLGKKFLDMRMNSIALR